MIAAGVRLGRPRELPDGVVDRISTTRREGKSLRAIAASLNDDGVPTAHGGAGWHASTVRAVLASAVPGHRPLPRGERGGGEPGSPDPHAAYALRPAYYEATAGRRSRLSVARWYFSKRRVTRRSSSKVPRP